MPEGFFEKSTVLRKQPTSRVAKCGACGLYQTCKSPKMAPSGRNRKSILIVGEAPGRNEDKRGTQLCGESGQYLEQRLKRAGVDMRRDCTLTNALICRPPDNATPTANQIEYCRPNLLKTIEAVKPNVIILLGGSAVDSLLGHLWRDSVGSVSRWAGFQIPDQTLNSWICPTYHPAFLIREKDKNKALQVHFDHHLATACDLDTRPWDQVPDYRSQVEVLTNTAEIIKRLRRIKSGLIAFDYETNMLKPESDDAAIACASVCWNGKQTFAFPWYGEVRAELKRLLQDPNVGKIASNIKFEDRWSRRIVKARVRNWVWDTMLAAHVLDNRHQITSLKFQCYVQLGFTVYDHHIHPFLKGEGGYGPNKVFDVNFPELLMYCGLDSLLEYELAMLQSRILKIPLKG